MKKIILPILLFVIVIISVIFFENKNSKKNKELYFSTVLDKEYVYTKNGEKTPITITFSQDKVYGFAGVNRYFAGYKVENNNIQFSPIGSTMMAGLEKDMKMENEYLSLLNDVNTVKVYRDRLELITKNNILLKFVENKEELPLKKVEEENNEKVQDDVVIEDEANLPQI